MATKAYTIERDTGCDRVIHVTWAAMANGDVGAPLQLNDYADRSIQVTGTFGAGGSMAMRGSNKLTPDVTVSADWYALSDPSSTTIALTASTTGKAILEGPLWLSPAVTAGDGTTALTPQFVGRQTWR